MMDRTRWPRWSGSSDGGHQTFEAAAVLHEVGLQSGVGRGDGGAAGVVEHGDHVGLDAQCPGIPTPKGVFQDPDHGPIPLARPMVVGVVLGVVPPRILDVDVLGDDEDAVS